MGHEIGRARADEREQVVALVASAQARPDRHVCYLSLEPAAIDAELAQLAPDGWAGVLVARRSGAVVGALGVEHDRHPPRVWWHGPYVADVEPFTAIGEALLDVGSRFLPAHVVEEEFGPDDRHRDLAALATRRGALADPASAVLSRATRPAIEQPSIDGVRVRPATSADHAAVAAIHDDAFPQAHVPGDRVADGPQSRVVLVADRARTVVGYAAAERQEDGAGYLDLLAVSPVDRGQGIGALLTASVVDHLGRRGCATIHLTVRETNAEARRLYARLGFDEERLIRPHRRGFTMR